MTKRSLKVTKQQLETVCSRFQVIIHISSLYCVLCEQTKDNSAFVYISSLSPVVYVIIHISSLEMQLTIVDGNVI